MATIMPASELLKRAFAHLLEERAAHPEKPLAALMDEASMRFILSPLDAESLFRLLRDEETHRDDETRQEKSY